MLKLLCAIIMILFSNLIISFFLNKKKSHYIILTSFIIITSLFILERNITTFIIVYFLNNLIVLFVYFNDIKLVIKKSIKKYVMIIFIIINISLGLELTLFNFRSYTTNYYNEIKISEEDYSTNMKHISDNKYKIISNDERPYIEIENINKKINNIYLDIKSKSKESYYVIPFYTDSGNKLYQQLESRELHDAVDKSKTLNFNFSGKSNKIKFEFTFEKDEIVTINNIIINYNIPLDINLIRVTFVCIVLFFIFLFRPKSELYKINYNEIKHKKVLFVVIFSIIVISYSVLSINSILSIKNVHNHNVHNNLANSLIEGKTYFKDTNNSEEILNSMDNPYDTNLRDKLFAEKGTYFLWDCAFYKGKYYSYFGVVPVALFYVPYKLITNLDLSTAFLNYLLATISAILLVVLLHQIVRKYFKKCSLGLFLLLSLALIYCSGLMYVLKLPTLYSIPIVSGLMFTYLGLNLLIASLNKEKLRIFYLFLGSLSMALVAGCRPQLLLGSFFIIPIGYLYLEEKKRTKKEIIKSIISICIPYMVVAAVLMYYNYIRFGSVFDFGANYNLTTNDMTSRGFNLARIPLGLCIYLFNNINMKNVFPYIVGTELYTNYLGVTIYEPVYGGVFLSVIFTAINLFIFKLKKRINSNFIFYTCLFCIISSIIIIIADTEMAGILARYITDFSWLLVFSSTLIVLKLYNNGRFNKRVLIKIVLILVVISLIYQFFYYFVSIENKFKNNNLQFWLEFYYLFQFWL